MKPSTVISNKRNTAPAQSSILEYLHTCPICAHSDLRHYCRVPSLTTEGEFIRYDRCGRCRTVLRNPRVPPAARVAKYEEKSLPVEDTKLDPKSQAHYAYMMRVLEDQMPGGAGRRLLDFGCGAGGFLVEARAAGFEVMGLELNRELAKHVKEAYGIEVFQGLVSDSDFARERFNTIITSQVFEHLLDPRETLAVLRRLLAPPGFILIEVPSLLDIRERLKRGSLMDDSHLFYFTPKSLCWLLADSGFHICKVQNGLRPYRFSHQSARRSPLWLLDLVERVFSLLQIKTGLTVLARLR